MEFLSRVVFSAQSFATEEKKSQFILFYFAVVFFIVFVVYSIKDTKYAY